MGICGHAGQKRSRLCCSLCSWQERERADHHGYGGPAQGPRVRGLPRSLPLPEREIGDWEIPTASPQSPGGKGEAIAQGRIDWNRIVSMNALHRGKKEDL
jgi:hypothetical protein